MEAAMKPKGLWEAFGRVALSLAFAGVFYLVWMGAFLGVRTLESPILEALGWLLAPFVTAAGFTVGMLLGESGAGRRKIGFLRVAIWPLVGCAVGAGSVVWMGPMLIVFGMLAAGTASVALREWVLWRTGPKARD
jgi:hypothetical protein